MEGLLKISDNVVGGPFEYLLNQLPGPIAIYKGNEFRYAYINESYQNIFGSKELLGKTLKELFTDKVALDFITILEQVYDSGIPFYSNESNLLLDFHNQDNQTHLLYQFAYSVYKNEDSSIAGVVAYGQYITGEASIVKKRSENESRLRNILEHARDPILILKGENLILDLANEPLFKLWDVDRESLGKPFLDILPEMNEQGFFDLLQNVYRNGESHYGYETPVYFIRQPDKKELRYFNFMCQPFRESNHHISGVLVMAYDVTNQVLAKQKLTQSELNFRNMILQIPAAVCVLRGPDHVVEVANQTAYDILGRNAFELTGKPIRIGLPELEEQSKLEFLNQVYLTGERFIANERSINLLRNNKAETAYINFVFEALKSSDGRISGIICIGTEVTDQVLARKNSEFAEERARLAIGSADLGTYEINLDNDEMITSPRFRNVWGFDHVTVNRSEYAAAIHPDDLALRAKAHKESIETGNLHYECRIIWKDKSIHWVKVQGRILYDDHQKPVWLLGVIQDITEQKLFSEELSRNVRERTKSLREINERLERSNEELEQFAYITSHDLQEPLRKIQIYSNILLESYREVINTKGLQMLEKVTNSASRMSGLIRNLLDYSRITQSEILFEETDLNIIMRNVLFDYELMVTQRNAVINLDLLPFIQTVPLQMNQLFYNLIGNALKFSKKNSSPLINVNCSILSPEKKQKFPQLNADKEYYEFIFQDNGIGFQQEYADKIFVIFQKLNAQSMFGGYGVGLAICRKIVENHHGIIYATGKINEGAKFICILPSQQDKF